jgi:hypothetical protein
MSVLVKIVGTPALQALNLDSTGKFVLRRSSSNLATDPLIRRVDLGLTVGGTFRELDDADYTGGRVSFVGWDGTQPVLSGNGANLQVVSGQSLTLAPEVLNQKIVLRGRAPYTGDGKLKLRYLENRLGEPAADFTVSIPIKVIAGSGSGGIN